MNDNDRIERAYLTARKALLAERNSDGHWVGELSTSALSTATAIMALFQRDRDRFQPLIQGGLNWLQANQNADGGWGDTVRSFSNISTTALCRAAIHLVGATQTHRESLIRCEAWLGERCGSTPAELAEAIRNRYGKDRTFAVPILTACALAGLVPWREVPRLPFELACLPQSWYRFARMPVVSYALPALIAIGQCIHFHRGTWNPITKVLRWLGKGRSLKVLERIQPSSGGYLEAAPLTSFVVMSLCSLPLQADSPAQRVIDAGVRFLVEGVRPDGSWPIDSNLSIWVTTLSINALATAGDLEALAEPEKTTRWLLEQQTQTRHPFTGAAPGAWGWSHLPGSVPDCDDTPSALIALRHLQKRVESTLATRIEEASRAGGKWIADLQNSDGGWPTFCRGWGKLPFDRSGSDLTAHALRALAPMRNERPFAAGLKYLQRMQRPDGSWLPLWFGNQHAPDDENPIYGTARVLAAYRDLGLSAAAECAAGVRYLLSAQQTDGSWGSVEETALALEVLCDLAVDSDHKALSRAADWLIAKGEDGSWQEPSPIGFYFAKLWYFEKMYPLVFTVAALGRWRMQLSRKK